MNTTYLSLEIKRIVRSPQFTIFTIGMPTAMYLLFGSIFGDTLLDNGLHSSTQTMITMAAYGASGVPCSPAPASPRNAPTAGSGRSV